MYENLKQQILIYVLLLLATIAIGYLSGEWFLVAILLFSGYFFWQIRQVYLLERWILQIDNQAFDDLQGIWQYLAMTLKRHQKASRKRKRRLTRLLQRFHYTLELLPDAILITDTSANVQWLNASADRLLGLSRKAIGMRLSDLPGLQTLVSYLEKGDYDNGLECLSPVNGSIELAIQVMSYSKDQLLITAHDITDIKKVESIRREFLANVSHELRTPLTVVAGYLELLESENLSPDILQVVESSIRQTSRMQTLVSDLLMLSKLEMNEDVRLIEESVNVAALLTSLIEDAKKLGEVGGYEFSLQADQSIFMLGNEAELSSAFGNLVFNAVLHTPPRTKIKLSWQRSAGQLRFAVEDNGEGIEAKHLAHLTERFYRVDKGRSRERGGTGLGLAITRHVVQRHDGEVRIESQVGLGTTFSCLFPLERAVIKESG